MKNKKIGAIVKNEIERNVKSKWFIILNIVLLVVVVGGFNFTTIQNIFKSNNVAIAIEKQLKMYIVDENKLAIDNIRRVFENDTSILIEEKLNTDEYENENISSDVVIVKIEQDDTEYIRASIISKESMSAHYINVIETELISIKNSMFAKDKNLTLEEIKEIKSGVEINRVMLGINGEKTTDIEFIKIGSNYLIFFILLLCLNKIANTISQEKMSKSIEYILTSISAKEYIISKVIGMCMIVVMQAIFMLVFIVIALVTNMILNTYFIDSATMINQSNLSSVGGFILNPEIIGYILVIFVFMIITTVLLGIIQAVMSAKTTNIQEAGNATLILVMLNLVLYTITTVLISSTKAYGVLTYIISVLPIASMYFIPTMFIIGQVSVIQIIISFVVLCISIPLTLKFAETRFRNAILDYAPKKEKKIEGIEKIISTRKYQERLIDRKDSAKKGFAIGLAISLLIIIQVIGGLIGTVLIDPILGLIGNKLSYDNVYLIVNCIIMILSLIIPYFVLKSYMVKEEKLEESKEDKKKSVIKCLKYILISIPIMSCIQVICSFAIEKIGIGVNITDKLGIFEYKGVISTILMFIQIAIIPAIFEELMIRKGIIGVLKEKGTIFAVFVSSIVFGIIHMNISQFIFAFLIGILYGVVRIKTNKLYPVIILHFLNNGFAVVSALFYENIKFMDIFTYFSIAINAIGFSLLIFAAYKKIMELKDSEAIEKFKEDFDYRKIKINLIENLYVFHDFTLIVSVILSATVFIALEKVLSLMN